jgi:hypothetical protein
MDNERKQDQNCEEAVWEVLVCLLGKSLLYFFILHQSNSPEKLKDLHREFQPNSLEQIENLVSEFQSNSPEQIEVSIPEIQSNSLVQIEDLVPEISRFNANQEDFSSVDNMKPTTHIYQIKSKLREVSIPPIFTRIDSDSF